MKSITIILTKYSDPVSNLVHLISGFGYTHVSLGLDTCGNEIYSFNFKGFCEESFAKHRRRGVKYSRVYQPQISNDSYERLRNRCHYFLEHKSEYHYSLLGVIFSFLRIPHKRKNYYFCSHFVAELLSKAGVMTLKCPSSLYQPNHFCRELAHSAQLQRVRFNPI